MHNSSSAAVAVTRAADVALAQSMVNIRTVRLGDVGNRPDTNGIGLVSYRPSIGKYKGSVSQCLAFLNSVQAFDVTGNGDLPVSGVSWCSAAHFCNWLHDGATNGVDTDHVLDTRVARSCRARPGVTKH